MYEIHNARELNSASKIELDNLRLRDKKIQTRQAHQPAGIMAVPVLKPEDTATPLTSQPKHTVC